MPVEEGSHTRE